MLHIHVWKYVTAYKTSGQSNLT